MLLARVATETVFSFWITLFLLKYVFPTVKIGQENRVGSNMIERLIQGWQDGSASKSVSAKSEGPWIWSQVSTLVEREKTTPKSCPWAFVCVLWQVCIYTINQSVKKID